jgi:GT2 family glycosyltransferase
LIINQSLVSIIILNFNGERYLNNCLSTVFETKYGNYEIILVDNASTDSSIKNALAKFGNDPRLKIVYNKKNLGFSGGNNVGFTYSSGEYIVFLNNDTEVDPDWLGYLVESLQNDASIGLAQGRILMIDGAKIQTAGWLFTDYLVHKHGLGENKRSDLAFKPVFEVSVASGAAMITRRSLIEEIGLFDPAIPFFYDDTLLSFKVWLANKRVVTVSNAKIRHMLGATSVWNIQSTTFNLMKAKICLTFDVYYRLDQLAKAFAVDFFSLSYEHFFNVRKKNLAVVVANIQAAIWGLRNLRFLWRNRLDHWSTTKVSSETLQAKFVRIKLPTAYYIVPSKIGKAHLSKKVNDYERKYCQI